MTKSITIKGLELGSGIPKICVPLTQTSQTSLYEEAEEIKACGPDLAEWRADFYKDLTDGERLTETLKTLTQILNSIPLIFTIRTRQEGGEAMLSLEDYIRINTLAARSQLTDLIDVEVLDHPEEKKTLIRTLQAEGIPVIGSSHDFQKTDSFRQLLDRFARIEASGADILKLAVMPQSFEDVTTLMNATHTMTTRTTKPIISMSMSALGALSRYTGENYGSALTFATVTTASAPGQIPLKTLRPLLQTLHTL